MHIPRGVLVMFAFLRICLAQTEMAEDRNWSSEFYFPESQIPGGVRAMIARPGGGIFYGGNFSGVAGIANTAGVAEWTGSEWKSLGTGLDRASKGSIHCMVLKGTELYVGGAFTNIGGISNTNIAMWDGTEWHALGSGIASGTVKALAILGEKLVAGGQFTNADAVPVSNLALWDGTGWSSAFGGVLNSNKSVPQAVSSLTVVQGTLYVGGAFQKAGASAATNIAWLNGDHWEPLLDHGTNGTRYPVNTMIEYENHLLVGLNTTDRVREYSDLLLQWNGTNWKWLGGISVNRMSPAGISALAVHGTDLYMSTASVDAGGVKIMTLGRWDGGRWNDVALPASAVRAMASDGSSLYAAAIVGSAVDGTSSYFIPPTGILRYNGDKWRLMGAGLSPFDVEFGPVASFHDRVFIAGTFHTGSMAEWTNGQWVARGPQGKVFAIHSASDKMYVVGNIPAYPPELPYNNIAGYDGTNWFALGAGIPTAYAVASRGTEVFAGHTGGISRWNGSNWFAMADGPNGTVTSIAILDNDVYASGLFERAGSSLVNGIARWDGNQWWPLGAGLEGQASVVVSQGVLYAFGAFTRAGSTLTAGLARWDGTNWFAVPGLAEGSVINSAVTGPEGELYVGGKFTTTTQPSISYLARWDGTNWSGMGSGVNKDVLGLALDGPDLYVTGFFTAAGGKPSNLFAHWHEAEDPPRLRIELSGGRLLISMPDRSGYLLEKASLLGPLTSWTEVPMGAAENQLNVTNHVSNGTVFYRMRRP
jgi:trimeric autotransporter adhesin